MIPQLSVSGMAKKSSTLESLPKKSARLISLKNMTSILLEPMHIISTLPMSLSLTQKLHKDCHTGKRLLMSYCVTDEIFAVSISRDRPVTFSYMMGLILPSVVGWTVGTICGGIANNLLPASVQSALGLALYAMFVAIVMPPARKNPSIAIVAVIALVISCILKYAPILNRISSGFAIILCTIIAAAVGAILFPVEATGEVDS